MKHNLQNSRSVLDCGQSSAAFSFSLMETVENWVSEKILKFKET